MILDNTGLQYHIDVFRSENGTTELAGWLFSHDAAPRALLLETVSGPLPIEYGLDSPDVEAAFPAEPQTPSRARFQAKFANLSPPDFPRCVMRVQLEDDSSVEIPLGAPAVDDPGKVHFLGFVEMLAGSPAGHCLEIGSRARSGVVRRGIVPADWRYTGFDLIDGENVDVVGDAHELTTYFEPGSFDVVMAFSVLEHILMPWKFAIEVNRVLKAGGVAFFQTHQTYPIHDPPWDFWRFSSDAWPALFNAKTGFEIVSAAMGERAEVRGANGPLDSPGYLLSTVLVRKVSETELTWDVSLRDVLGEEKYIDAK